MKNTVTACELYCVSTVAPWMASGELVALDDWMIVTGLGNKQEIVLSSRDTNFQMPDICPVYFPIFVCSVYTT